MDLGLGGAVRNEHKDRAILEFCCSDPQEARKVSERTVVQ